MAIRTNTHRGQAGGTPRAGQERVAQAAPQSVAQPAPQSAAQPAPQRARMKTPAQPAVAPPPPTPPGPVEATEAWKPAPHEVTGTVLDELATLMDPMMWRVYLAMITYAQLMDDLSRGQATLTTEYEGAVLSPFIGFGPLQQWRAIQSDIGPAMLRILMRWMKDPARRAESSCTWQVMHELTPNLCLLSKGQEAFDESLVVLERIKPEFV